MGIARWESEEDRGKLVTTRERIFRDRACYSGCFTLVGWLDVVQELVDPGKTVDADCNNDL